MASVSSLDQDMRKLRLGRYTPQAANEARTWIEETLGDRLPPGDLLEALERLRGDLDRRLVATREGTKAGSGDVGLGIGMEAMKGKESMEI